MKREITIVGGGLSGLALANGLRLADVPVRVIEAGHYPRHRVCGEFMAGLTRSTIQVLGLESCFADALQHRTTQWFRRGSPVRRYTLPRPATAISRFSIDSQMARLLQERGGELLEGTRHSLQPEEGVIFTCGRNPRQGGYIGLKGHWSDIPQGLPNEGPSPGGATDRTSDLELHLGKDCYVGLSAVEEGFVNVCGLFRSIAEGSFSSPVERFHATLRDCGLGYLAQRLEAARYREDSFCSVSGLFYGKPSRDQRATMGDTYRLIPPFTGNGMTIAIESAQRLLPAAVAYAEGVIDWATFLEKKAETLQTAFNRRYWIAGLLHPFLLRPGPQSLLCSLARANLIPFKTLYSLTH